MHNAFRQPRLRLRGGAGGIANGTTVRSHAREIARLLHKNRREQLIPRGRQHDHLSTLWLCEMAGLALLVYHGIDCNMNRKRTDPAILMARRLFERSGKSLEQLGQAMGLSAEVARRGAWQFLNRVTDPKISTLRRVAKALGVPIEYLVSEGRRRSEKGM